MKNYYEILEVNEHASKEIIEKAYRTLVKRYHPDLYSSTQKQLAEQKLRDLNEAYDVLSDDFLRRQYDREFQKEQESKTIEAGENQNQNRNRRNTSSQNKNRKEDINARTNTKMNNTVGTFSIVGMLKDLIVQKFRNREKRKLNQTDFLAIGLTVVIVVLIGVVLWFIPFTNGWMRQLLFENPLFNFIGGLFSR